LYEQLTAVGVHSNNYLQRISQPADGSQQPFSFFFSILQLFGTAKNSVRLLKRPGVERVSSAAGEMPDDPNNSSKDWLLKLSLLAAHNTD